MIKFAIGEVFLTLLMVFFPAQILFAQEGQWKTYTVNDGLALNDVRAIAVAGDFVWFGTFGGGLSRFEKSTGLWTTIDTSGHEILSNFIYALAVDGEYLWIGTDKGVSRYEPGTGTWMNLDSLRCVSGIAVGLHDVWFSTRGQGVYRYKRSSGKLTALNTGNSSLLNDFVTSVTVDGDFAWFGTISGVNRHKPATGEWQVFTPPNTGGGPRDSTGYAIAADDESMWFGHIPGYSGEFNRLIRLIQIPNPTNCSPLRYVSEVSISVPGGSNPSISRWDRQSNKWHGFETSIAGPDTFNLEKICFPVYSVTAAPGEVWFGTGNNGLYRLQKSSNTLTNLNSTNSGLAGDLVWSIAIDADEVWFGTGGSGVSRFRREPELWKTYRLADGLCEESIQTIDVFGDEAWFGSNFGLNRLQISTGGWQCFTPMNSGLESFVVWAVAVDSQYVWTAPGLQRYEKATSTWTDISVIDSLLGNSSVTAIYAGNDLVWFGADDGKVSVYAKSTNKWRLFDMDTTLLNSRIEEIDVAGNEVWFASFDGVGHYDKVSGKWEYFDATAIGFSFNWLTGVAIDGDSVWVSAQGGGLLLYDINTGTWQVFTEAKTGQLFFDFLWSVDVDGQFVWCGGQAARVYRYEKPTGQWRIFTPLNSAIVDGDVWDIEVSNPFVWFTSYNDLGQFQYSGGVTRFGDVSAPSLVHAPVTIEQPSMQPVLIIASISDNVSVKSANIFFRNASDETYKNVPLQQLPGDTWIGQMPAFDVAPGMMEYYLAATDGRNTTTHPFSGAANSPHRFRVYDSVPPNALASISSATGFLADSTTLNVSLNVDGTGSIPKIVRLALIGYSDFSAVNPIDTLAITLVDSQQSSNNFILSATGKIELGVIAEDIAGIKLLICVTDEGRDVANNPYFTCGLSNPLFRFAGAVNVNAEEGGILHDDTRRARLELAARALSQDATIRFLATDAPRNASLPTVGPAFTIESDGATLRKPGILSISVREHDWSQVAAKDKLAIFRLQKDNETAFSIAAKVGGSVDVEKREITTAIRDFGYYAVLEGDFAGQVESQFTSRLDCVPRAISPGGSRRKPQTTITLVLEKDAQVTIKVLNPAGRLKRTIVENEAMPSGANTKIWDGRDDGNRIVASGIYIIYVEAGSRVLTRTVLVMK